MLIRLESYLSSIRKYEKFENDKGAAEYLERKNKETLIVISEKINFNKIDGYIQFMKLALDQAVKFYGRQNKDWQKIIDKIYNTAEKLQDNAVKFTGSTQSDFKIYCEQLSKILDKEPQSHIPVLSIICETDSSMKSILEKHLTAGRSIGFSYDEAENAEKEFINDLMSQLSNFKMEKSSRNFDISYYLMGSGYHEHVHDAMNTLKSTAVYAINCRSTRERQANGFDISKIENNLDYVKTIMEQVKHLV